MEKIKNNHFLIVALAAAAIFFSHLDVLIVNIMEARNFVTAREMIDDGHWLLTTLNGEARYEKPPLPSWLTALFAIVFGMKNLIALRMPAAILGLVLVLYSYKFSLKIFKDKNFALMGALILATSFYIVSAGRDANWDIFNHGFMMGSIYFLYLFFSEEKRLYQNALIAALFFGCSFLSKGPVSLYTLLLPFLISFGIVYKFKNLKKRLLPLATFLVTALLLSGWWYWYTYTYDTQAVTEITQKETGNWTSYNVRPFYYYWSFFTQSGVWTLPAFIALIYPYLKNRVRDKKGYLFTFLWTMGSVVLLSIIPEKKSRYLLPVLIPMALNTAYYIDYLIRRFAELKDKRETIPVYFNFGLIALIGLLFPVGGFVFLGDQLEGNWIWFILLALALAIIAVLLLRNLIQKKIKPVFFLTIAFIISILLLGMPMAKALTVNPEYKSLVQLNDWQAETELPVFEFGGFTPELIWAYGKPIKSLKNKAGVVQMNLTDNHTSFGVLVSEDNTKLFQRTFKNYVIEKVTRYDMNPQGPGERTHRPRLWRDFYVVTKK